MQRPRIIKQDALPRVHLALVQVLATLEEGVELGRGRVPHLDLAVQRRDGRLGLGAAASGGGPGPRRRHPVVVVGEGRQEGRAPVDLVHAADELRLGPPRPAAAPGQLVPGLLVVADVRVHGVADAQRPQVDDGFGGAVHVCAWVVVVVVHGDCREGVEGVRVGVEQVHGCAVGICEDAGAACGCGLDAVEELDVRGVLEVEQVCVEAQVV